MPIRILHVVDSLGKGGLENGLVNIVRRLGTDFDHAVVAIRRLGPNAERLCAARARVACLERPATSHSDVVSLVRAIRQFRPHVVHSRNWGAIEAVPAGRLARVRAVVHSEHGIEASFETGEPWRRTCFRRLAFELAHRVLSVSCQLRDHYARRTRFPAEKITVIHNGVDTGQFSPNPAMRERVRASLGVNSETFLIGCVGNLLPVKDHMTLLRALPRFHARVENWKLLIVGEGPERTVLEAFLAADAGLRERVMLGGLRNDVPELLTGMDTLVLSSLAEGISNALLEAMATGVPVVATNTGGTPEIIADGQSGLLFPVGDSETLAGHLLKLQGCPEIANQLAGQALCLVRDNFSMESMIRNYRLLYESLVPDLAASASWAAASV